MYFIDVDNERLDEFTSLGLDVVSISVDSVEIISAYAESRQIRFTMLADPRGDINEALGIRDPQYPLGSAAFGVSLPVLYVIDRERVVRAQHMEDTYLTRPDLDVVLREAGRLDL